MLLFKKNLISLSALACCLMVSTHAMASYHPFSNTETLSVQISNSTNSAIDCDHYHVDKSQSAITNTGGSDHISAGGTATVEFISTSGLSANIDGHLNCHAISNNAKLAEIHIHYQSHMAGKVEYNDVRTLPENSAIGTDTSDYKIKSTRATNGNNVGTAKSVLINVTG